MGLNLVECRNKCPQSVESYTPQLKNKRIRLYSKRARKYALIFNLCLIGAYLLLLRCAYTWVYTVYRQQRCRRLNLQVHRACYVKLSTVNQVYLAATKFGGFAAFWVIIEHAKFSWFTVWMIWALYKSSWYAGYCNIALLIFTQYTWKGTKCSVVGD